ncbi:hypothetical protein J2X09_005395 [Hydrogenophaga laconesensis]|uniref:Uncharacterized protein n=1 Tax=Hydrogenophaga laconesensis TaxID=1805971 RepID=A0ABU1VJE9_9BURK|nr:hypothetical protein [Hydrogenophaga laconesensis]
MRRVAIALAVAVLGTAHAADGHNGIRFDMKREDLQRMGFVCRDSTEESTRGQVRCAHMEMTGRAFSKNLERYRVDLGPDGAILQILADLVDPPTTLGGMTNITDDMRLFYPIEHQFPPEYRRLMPNVFRYSNSEGAGVQFGYFARSRTASIIFYPKGSMKP